MKRFAIIGGIVVAVLLLIVLLVPLFINVDSFRPEVEQKLSAALGRKVTIGKLSASIFSGAEADNISISDDPAFSRAAFLQASKLQIGVEWWPLYAMLIYTGLRIGEGQGLVWGDVRLADRRLTVSDHIRRLKTIGSSRDVPVPDPLAELLAAHRLASSGPPDPAAIADCSQAPPSPTRDSR